MTTTLTTPTQTLTNGFNKAIIIISHDGKHYYRSGTNTWHDDKSVTITIPSFLRAFTYCTERSCAEDLVPDGCSELFTWKEFCAYTGLRPSCRNVEDNPWK